jgi:hypothetical protein
MHNLKHYITNYMVPTTTPMACQLQQDLMQPPVMCPEASIMSMDTQFKDLEDNLNKYISSYIGWMTLPSLCNIGFEMI